MLPPGVDDELPSEGFGRRTPFRCGLGQLNRCLIHFSISISTFPFCTIQGSWRIARGAGRRVPSMVRLRRVASAISSSGEWMNQVPGVHKVLHRLRPHSARLTIWTFRLILELWNVTVHNHAEQLDGTKVWWIWELIPSKLQDRQARRPDVGTD